MMKKILLFSLAMAFSFGLVAQSPLQKQAERVSKISIQKTEAQAEYQSDYSGEINPFLSNIKAPDVVIGKTRYDLQSNASMATRIHAYGDGTIAGTWTMGFVETSFPERGTGYNYYNGSSWGPQPTARIEPVRNGWPSYQPYGENGEIVCSHTGGTAGLIFSHRENKGTGTWNHFYLQGPDGHQDLLWPRMITTGDFNEIIHVIAVVPSVASGGTVYEGLDGALLYSRSYDGGQTWDQQNVILPGLTSEEWYGFGGDEYGWAAPMGETIAFVTGSFLTDGAVIKSTDNGDTWERLTFYTAPAPRFNNEFVIPDHGGIDGYNAATIDDMGMVHVAAGRMIIAADGTGGPTNFYPYSNGLLYWNETMPSLDSSTVKSDILDPSVMNPANLLAEVYDNGVDTIIGVATYQASLTSMPQMAFDPASKILYAFYSALTVGFATEDYNYRHVWMRFSDDYGQTWSPQQDLTGDIFHIFSECVFPSVASKMTGGKVHLIYQTSNQPGINQRYETHAVNDNNIVYLGVNTVVGIEEKPANILAIDQISPNPATDVAQVVIHVDSPVTANISITNIQGQEVYQSTNAFGFAGPHLIKLDVSNYESGIYFVRVKAGNSSSVKKLIIN